MNNNRILSKLVMVGAAVAVLSSISVFQAEAKPEFAKKEGKKCEFCHTIIPKRGFRGLYYKAHKLSLKGFDEAKESKKAGVKAGSVGKAGEAKAGYKG